jgi:hypothetical protein
MIKNTPKIIEIYISWLMMKAIPKRINIRDVTNIYTNLLLYFISLKENNKGYMFMSMIIIPIAIQIA